MRVLKWAALGFATLVVLVVLVAAWLLGTQSGARWVGNRALGVLEGKLEIGALEGTLAGPLTVRDVRYSDPAAGLEASVEQATLDVALARLFGLTVHVSSFDARGIDVALSEPAEPAPEPPKRDEPFSLEPPIDVVVEAFEVSDVSVRSAGESLVDVRRATFAGYWTGAGLAIERLDVLARQGEVHLNGQLAQREHYVGEARGRFRWQAGERTYSGELTSRAEEGEANLSVQLAAPVEADLEASIEQTDSMPWRFTLEVPKFDPRASLMPEGSLYSLAASLNGAGSLEAGKVEGRLLINGEPLTIESLAYARGEQRLTLDGSVRVGEEQGRLDTQAEVDLAGEAPIAAATLGWAEVVIPAEWAGQILHTRGAIDLNGNAQQYQVKGEFSLGPPERVADIALEVRGTPQRVDLAQLDIVQPEGRLAMRGHVELDPAVAWDVTATARSFDPGAFAAAWRGNLAFDLASAGTLTEQGPDVSLSMTDLRGQLRGREVSGNADVSLTPNLVPAGTFVLRSADSSLRFEGERGEQIDATVRIDIASFDDLVPDTGGALDARLRVRGSWPELSIVGDASGSEVELAGVRIEKLDLDARVDNPREPEGTLALTLTKLAAAGFEFDSIEARGSGGLAQHRAELRATGSPLAFEIELRGGQTDTGWSGVLQTLSLDVKDAANLALRAPANIELAEGALKVSQACLVDGRIELCAAASTQPDGALQASYLLANVPLELANVVSPVDLPLRFAGLLEGQGQIERTADGALSGRVSIGSPSGRISRHSLITEEEAAEESEPAPLLTYEQLQLDAVLDGSDARGTIGAQLGRDGKLEGEVALRGLDAAETNIGGRLDAAIPDLAPLGVFVPQLANLGGRADAQLRFGGTLAKPQLDGTVSASELKADIPALGLHLTEGRLEARPRPAGDFALSGGVRSGEGRLEFSGTASPAGAIELEVAGERVLAADIPGARVIVTPDLALSRSEERVRLSGEVMIPEAAVNLQKLPRGERAQQASSDVVVVDAETREEEAQQVPLYAEITVVLGEKVELTGFGLDAKLEGRLDVRESPGEPTVGSGEIALAGQYKAYGQDLTIQQGRLLYAQTPLDNPRLSIEATRTVGEVTAGLRVRGNAQNPELTIFSDPPMAQSNALAYLVAGKPLDDIGAGDAEGDAMQTAARSLGTAAGGLLAKNIGRRLGVDEVAVKDEELIGGAALTVGQYLSPRLYLSYGIGLFEPGDVVTLRYKISRELALKTQTGPEDTRAGVEYRIER